MRIHWVQHDPFEGLGNILSWIEQKSFCLTSTKVFAGEPLPNPDSFDLLILMGGPMSVNDEERYPWLKVEKKLIKESIEQGKKILGICLGAQLIASALGANVYPNRTKEIGWLPVKTLSRSSSKLSSLFPQGDSFVVFHWHGETFELPNGAIHLIESDGCNNQAFSLSEDRVIGLQFHLEMTPISVQTMVKNFSNELVEGFYIQPASKILQQDTRFSSCREIMFKLLEHLQTA